jgi:thiol-disulfide isomerase/thioredoxin
MPKRCEFTKAFLTLISSDKRKQANLNPIIIGQKIIGMKKIIPLFILIALLGGFNEKPQVGSISFRGVITSPPDTKFTMVKLNSAGARQDVPIAADGTFKLTITSGTGRYLFHNGRGRIDLYLVEGDDVKIAIDGNKLYSSAKITGNQAGGSEYLIAKPHRYMALREGNEKFYALPEKEYKQRARKLRDDLYGLLDSLKNVPAAFSTEERKELHYNYLYNLASYEGLHQRFGKQPGFKVSAKFLDEVRAIDLSNEADYKTYPAYKKLVPAYYEASIAKLVKQDVDRNLAKIKVYATIPNEYIKNDLINSTASTMSMAKDIDEFYNAFISSSSSASNNSKLKAKYDELKQVVAGKLSPDFTEYENHAGGKTSLSDLRGKYIYIDVWATWCAPCLAELPSLKKIEKQFQGKDIHFLSISIDTEPAYKAWVKMVKDKEMGGIQLLADNAWSSKFISAYGISAIPRFILIDPDGNIVSPNAPRPSDPALITLLNDLKL